MQKETHESVNYYILYIPCGTKLATFHSRHIACHSKKYVSKQHNSFMIISSGKTNLTFSWFLRVHHFSSTTAMQFIPIQTESNVNHNDTHKHRPHL